MLEELYNFYFNKEEPNKSCLLALRSIILEQDKNITETQKYKMHCFCYKNKMFCYLWTDKKTDEPYILFVEGMHLNHPDLEKGNRSRMKIFRIKIFFVKFPFFMQKNGVTLCINYCPIAGVARYDIIIINEEHNVCR